MSKQSDERNKASSIAVLTALAANVAVAVSKIIAYLFTRSSSMLAEAVHSLADSVNEVLLIVGGRQAVQEPTRMHPFGYARNRYVFAFVVAIFLFFGSGAFALWRGIEKLRDPEPIFYPGWAIAVLVVAMIFEGFALRTAVKRSAATQGNPSVGTFIKHAKTPELVVVLLEDLSALVGLSFAMAGVIATVVTGNARWDGFATIAIGALMVCISIVLAAKTRSLLIGEAAHPPVHQAIERSLTDGDTIEQILDLRTQHLGPELLLVAARIAVDEAADASDIARAIAAAKRRIKKAVPYECVIYLEPALS
ncbi:MAG: cation transporter [Myxococcales bacterium]|nr:cation transporter [Myxococcales bacterium]